jgi:hypothetical protein
LQAHLDTKATKDHNEDMTRELNDTVFFASRRGAEPNKGGKNTHTTDLVEALELIDQVHGLVAPGAGGHRRGLDLHTASRVCERQRIEQKKKKKKPPKTPRQQPTNTTKG